MSLTKEEREFLEEARKGLKASWTLLGTYSTIRRLFNIIARQNNLNPIE